MRTVRSAPQDARVSPFCVLAREERERWESSRKEEGCEIACFPFLSALFLSLLSLSLSLTFGAPVDTPASTIVAHELRDGLEAEAAAAAAFLSGRRSGIDRHCFGRGHRERAKRKKEEEKMASSAASLSFCFAFLSLRCTLSLSLSRSLFSSPIQEIQ